MTGTLLRSLPALIPDAELLGRFVAARDELAFAELVRRHGPVVYRVCRRVVGPNAADDAFQATFLVLATRGEKVRKAASVGSWLVGVAGRVARQMRRRDRQHPPHPPHPQLLSREGRGEPLTADLAAALDDELTRLPDDLRAAVVACLVQHRSQTQAAADLGTSERTLRRRLDKAKRLLRERLVRRGVVPAVAVAVVGGLAETLAGVPPGLPEQVVNLVFDFLAGGGAVASAPAVIAKGVSMSLKLWKVTMAVAAVGIGLTALGVVLAGDSPKEERIPAVDRQAPATKPLKPPSPFVGTVYEFVPAKCETKNFVVTSPDDVVTRAVANEAESQRKLFAERWLGRELPAWDKPCAITVEVSPTKTSGATTFTFGSGDEPPALKSAEMSLSGSLENLLRVQVPHEVSHCVLASYFGKPLPRWADEGITVASESIHEQAAHDAKVREMLKDERGITLRKLLPMKDYPKDLPVLYAQGHSVVRFLLAKFRKGDLRHTDDTPVKTAEEALLVFLRTGMAKDGGWDTAVKMYGFKDLDELQDAWIDWLRKPESSLADALPQRKPKPGDEGLIPPTRLGK